MAAGCSIAEEHFGDFDRALQQVASEWLDAATLTRTLRTDGPLALEWFNPQTVALLDAQVWGQGFEPPLFCDEVEVLQQRLVGEKHLKLQGAPRRHLARRHLVRPRRAAGRARAPGLPPEPGRVAGPAAGADGGRGGRLNAASGNIAHFLSRTDMRRLADPAAVQRRLAGLCGRAQAGERGARPGQPLGGGLPARRPLPGDRARRAAAHRRARRPPRRAHGRPARGGCRRPVRPARRGAGPEVRRQRAGLLELCRSRRGRQQHRGGARPAAGQPRSSTCR